MRKRHVDAPLLADTRAMAAARSVGATLRGEKRGNVEADAAGANDRDASAGFAAARSAESG